MSPRLQSGVGRARSAGEFWSEHYLSYLSTRPDSVVAALHAIAGSEGAAIVHCAAGKDRTGVVAAVLLGLGRGLNQGARKQFAREATNGVWMIEYVIFSSDFTAPPSV